MIDKKTAKFLNYIDKNKPDTDQLRKAMKEYNVDGEISHAHNLGALYIDVYFSANMVATVHSSMDGGMSAGNEQPVSGGSSSTHDVYSLSPSGRAILEEYTRRQSERLWTRGIALAAVFISLAALAVSILSLLSGQ